MNFTEYIIIIKYWYK